MQRQNKAFEVAFFDNIAASGHYETNSDEFYSHLFTILDRINYPSDGKLLECGCGTGAFGKRFLDRYPGLDSVTGVDISTKMIEAAKLQPTIRYSSFVGDLENPGLFQKGEFQTVLCPFILHHFPTIDLVLKNLPEWTRPSGYILLCEPNGSSPVSRAFKLARKVLEGILGKDWVMRHGLATPNETDHSIRTYKTSLIALGFTVVESKTLTIKQTFGSIWRLGAMIATVKQSLSLFADWVFRGTDLAGTTTIIVARKEAVVTSDSVFSGRKAKAI